MCMPPASPLPFVLPTILHAPKTTRSPSRVPCQGRALPKVCDPQGVVVDEMGQYVEGWPIVRSDHAGRVPYSGRATVPRGAFLFREGVGGLIRGVTLMPGDILGLPFRAPPITKEHHRYSPPPYRPLGMVVLSAHRGCLSMCGVVVWMGPLLWLWIELRGRVLFLGWGRGSVVGVVAGLRRYLLLGTWGLGDNSYYICRG